LHGGRPGRRRICAPDAPAQRSLGARGLLALRFLALALDAGLLVVLASASLSEDAALLDLLVEASQSALEGLVFAYADFSQFRDHLPPAGLRAEQLHGAGLRAGLRATAGHARAERHFAASGPAQFTARRANVNRGQSAY